MSLNSLQTKKSFVDWLKNIALESRSGVLYLRAGAKAYTFYFVLGEIRAVDGLRPQPEFGTPSASADQLLNFLLELAKDSTAEAEFSDSQEIPTAKTLIAQVSTRKALAKIAHSIQDDGALRGILNASGHRFVAAGPPGMESCAEILSSGEAYLLSRLEAPLTLDEVLSITPLDEAETLRQVYSLYLLGLVQAIPAPKSAVRPSIPAASPLPSESGTRPQNGTDWLHLKQEIEEQRYLLSHGNYYDLLNVSRQSKDDEIKTAYYTLAKRFHPDRYQSDAPAGLLEQVENLFCHLSEAYETLSKPAERAEYDQKLAAATPAPRKPASEFERAERSFAEGRKLFEHEHYARAEVYLKEAVTLKPEVARYRIMLGRALAKNPKHRKDAEEHFLKAIELDPKNALHYVELGKLYKEANLMTRAQKLFEQALQRNPTSEEVLRELGRAPHGSKSKKPLGGKFRKIFSKN